MDTDIILDVLLNREPHYEDSSLIFSSFENNKVKLFTSPSVIINAQYIAQKQLSKEKCRTAFKYLLQYFSIIDADKQVILEAYNSGFSDIEDAIQYYTVLNSGIIDFIITRNVKDYKRNNSRVLILTPGQFLKQLK